VTDGGHHHSGVKPVTWQREDAAYAAAAIAAAAVVVYFTIANFGLLPSPLAPGRLATGQSIGVPSLQALGAPAGPAQQPPVSAVPQFPTASRPLPAAPPTRPAAEAADRTPPRGTITTADGTQLTLTEPASVNGTASDAGTGVLSVTVTFAPTSGAAPTVAAARASCGDITRHACTWSADVPAVIGQYNVTATVTDRASHVSRAGPIVITVVNGGSAVKTVTDVVGGLVPGVTGVVGGLLSAL
jgi:hypothetical protein